MNRMKAVSPRLSWKKSLVSAFTAHRFRFTVKILELLRRWTFMIKSPNGLIAKSYPELTSPIKHNYPQSPWKILNRQFMQVFLFLFLSLHLLSLQLQSLFKLSFVIIKQQCKQLSQKPLPKLLEMISSVLLIWLKKIIFPNGGLYTLHYGFSTAFSLNWESGALGSLSGSSN